MEMSVEEYRKLMGLEDEEEELSSSSDQAQTENELRGHANKFAGKRAEAAAQQALVNLGVRMVEKIATPFFIVATRKIGIYVWFRLIFGEKVSGDIRGIMPGGKRVLAEVKYRSRDRILYSDLETHQIKALNDNAALGGISLLIFVDETYYISVMKWPIAGFGPRGARGFSSMTTKDCQHFLWEPEED